MPSANTERLHRNTNPVTARQIVVVGDCGPAPFLFWYNLRLEAHGAKNGSVRLKYTSWWIHNSFSGLYAAMFPVVT